MKSYNYYKQQGYIGREVIIPSDSGLINRTITDLEKEYSIIFDHLHQGKIDLKTKIEPKPEYKIEPNLGIHVWGRLTNLTRFLKDLSSKLD